MFDFKSDATTTADAIPVGATARPADLYLAWLLQCEHVWKLRDKLGLSIAEQGGGGEQLLGLSLAGMNLIPDVKLVLDTYTRRSLT